MVMQLNFLNFSFCEGALDTGAPNFIIEIINMTKYKNLYCVQEAKNLPLALDEIKHYLRIDEAHDDALLTRLAKRATKSFENYTGHILIESRWGVSVKNYTKSSLALPIAPLRSIEKITQYTHLGMSQQFPLSEVRIVPSRSEIYFNVHPLAYELQIEFVAGYGVDESAVPEDIKSLLLSHVAFLYENKGQTTEFPLSIYNEYKTWRI